MARITRKQRIRVRSYIQLGLLFAAGLVILAGIGLMIGRAIGKAAHREAAPVSTDFTVEEPEFTPEPTAPPQPMPDWALYPMMPTVDLSSWELRLVRKDHPLAVDFVPELMDIEEGERFDARAGAYLIQLIRDARAAGYGVYVCSGYRSYDTQYSIYWNHVDRFMRENGMTQAEAEATTLLSVNYPGASEHQLGLAADILEYRGQDMMPYIGGSGLMLWLEQHCADYGFIVRYPDGKTDITGIEYEPWHLRYVGSCARYLMDNDLCLEEFLTLYQERTNTLNHIQ